jgi:hypothetical protein
MKKMLPLSAVALFLAAPAIAQDHNHPATPAQAPAGRGGMMQGMAGMQGMGAMLGQHMMPVTITAIDAKTGLVDATAGSMTLKLHFPPPSLAGMKAGDKISVHLAFHKN